jgi:hypothetical protein
MGILSNASIIERTSGLPRKSETPQILLVVNQQGSFACRHAQEAALFQAQRICGSGRFALKNF